MRIFKGIDLKDVVIVDNYVYSFAFHLTNGIPIVPFMGEKDDIELVKLMKYIKYLHTQNDFRIINEKSFRLNRILNTNMNNFI